MTDKQYTSHDLARALHEVAAKLENAPPFPGVEYATFLLNFYEGELKPSFIAAVKAIGGGRKTSDDDDVMFKLTSEIGPLRVHLGIVRDAVCKKVRKTVTRTEDAWECEPLLTPAEEAEVIRG